MSFAETFTNLLKTKGVTLYRMSKDTGIPEATIGRWKNGKSTPTLDNLQIIAAYFGVDANYFLDVQIEEFEKNNPATAEKMKQLALLQAYTYILNEKNKNLEKQTAAKENAANVYKSLSATRDSLLNHKLEYDDNDEIKNPIEQLFSILFSLNKDEAIAVKKTLKDYLEQSDKEIAEAEQKIKDAELEGKKLDEVLEETKKHMDEESLKLIEKYSKD